MPALGRDGERIFHRLYICLQFASLLLSRLEAFVRYLHEYL